MRHILGLSCLAAFSLLLICTEAIAIIGILAGVNITTGERPLRRNINQLYVSGPAWDLFLLALRKFQQVNQADPLSYYQVAGIHGLPKIPWDGVLGQGEQSGYCTHAAVTFPTWHRPYVALFEQIIWKHAQSIARSYPLHQRDTYMTAALSLRMPYWDAFASPDLPVAASVPSITVNGPNGREVIDNPLYNYTFHANEGGNPFPPGHWLSQFPWTIRHWDASNQRSNISDVNAALRHQYQSVLSLTYNLFAMETDYTNMSCTTSGGNSIEHIHNSVHNAVGGYGHLTDSAASAFDPIFWLHHTNVDRLFAIWQAINPQSYIVPVVNPFGTYAQPRGFLESGDSNLLPFRVDNGTSFWTSNAVRSTRKFGYTYPELVDWNISEAALASEARASVNKLYNSGSANGTNYQRRRLKAETGKIGRLQPGGFTEAKEFGRNDFERQWTITVKIQRFAYPDPFAIDFFVGSPPVNPLAWPTASNLVGSFAQFIAANSEIVEVKASSQTLNHGEVSLTRYLVSAVQKGSLATLEPDSVIPFLTKSLHWRARDMKGRELQLESLAALSIAVGSQAVQPVKVFNQFPVYKELEIYGNITAGKPGGYGTRRTLRYWLR